MEQRAREVGLLRAVGFKPAAVRQLFLVRRAAALDRRQRRRGLGALGYAYLIMTALGTWWVDAVGTSALTLHVSWTSLVAGAGGGVAAAIACIWWTLRGLARISERSLLAGQIDLQQRPGPDRG